MFYISTTMCMHEDKLSLLERFTNAFNIIGYSRAAAELTRLGYHEQAANCMKEIERLRS